LLATLAALAARKGRGRFGKVPGSWIGDAAIHAGRLGSGSFGTCGSLSPSFSQCIRVRYIISLILPTNLFIFSLFSYKVPLSVPREREGKPKDRVIKLAEIYEMIIRSVTILTSLGILFNRIFCSTFPFFLSCGLHPQRICESGALLGRIHPSINPTRARKLWRGVGAWDNQCPWP
jgi:hypothetical protein